MVNIMRNQISTPQHGSFDVRAEIGLVVLSLSFFITCFFYPGLAENSISFWMKDAIINIEDTPIFGFVFKVIGFFFLLSIFGKIFQSILLIVSPRQMHPSSGQTDDKERNDFDDYEEITDEEK